MAAGPLPWNQVPPLVDHDPLASDPALRAALDAAGAPITGDLACLAIRVGSAPAAESARLADVHPPVLRSHDRGGARVDEVDVHPAWHALMDGAVTAGIAGHPWSAEAAPRAHLYRAAGFYLETQIESGHLCPVSMTYSAIPALRRAPDLAARFEPGLTSRVYEPGLRVPDGKAGLLAGMSMTERQGGSDVRANSTTAAPVDSAGERGYALTGHKWFTSAPMNDLFLTLAQTAAGPTCFLLPRVLPDGTRNALTLTRLKDKLGNRSNASAEIEYDGALAWRIGDEGRGVPTILQMVTLTRVDCVLGSAGQIRAALSEATHYAARRWAFGAPLVDQPAMTAVLADLAVESWAATLTALRLAELVDLAEAGGADAGGDVAGRARTLLRLAVPVSKFWVCKRAVPTIAEALECLGGNGFVETYPMARLLRESPLNSIWEGSGTVTALDALRAVGRDPGCAEAFLAEVTVGGTGSAEFAAALERLAAALRGTPGPADARPLAGLAARVFAASLLIRHAPAAVADLYCRTRLSLAGGDRVFGELPTAGRPLAGPPRRWWTAVTPRPAA